MKKVRLFGTMFVMTAALVQIAFAQDAREAEMIGLHQMCNQGDRKACVRFGMMIQQNHDRVEAWRHNHPEWFWFER